MNVELHYVEFRNVEALRRGRGRIKAKGEWDTEPDEMAWLDEETGLPCIASRAAAFTWCAYVGVPSSLEYDVDLLDVHGGVSGSLYWLTDEEKVPAHWQKALPNVDWANTRWPGFDCGHSILNDLAPAWAHEPQLKRDDGSVPVYRNKQFVIAECAKLAKQLHALFDRPLATERTIREYVRGFEAEYDTGSRVKLVDTYCPGCKRRVGLEDQLSAEDPAKYAAFPHASDCKILQWLTKGAK